MLFYIFWIDVPDRRCPLSGLSTVTKACLVSRQKTVQFLFCHSSSLYIMCLSLKLEIARFDFIQQIILNACFVVGQKYDIEQEHNSPFLNGDSIVSVNRTVLGGVPMQQHVQQMWSKVALEPLLLSSCCGDQSGPQSFQIPQVGNRAVVYLSGVIHSQS